MKNPVVRPVIDGRVRDKWQSAMAVMAEFMKADETMILALGQGSAQVVAASASGSRQAGQGIEDVRDYLETLVERKEPLAAELDLAPDDGQQTPAGWFLMYPLLWPDGQVFGAVCALFDDLETMGKDHHHIASHFQETVQARLDALSAQADLNKRSGLLHGLEGEVIVLRRLLPVCGHCKNVRDDGGYWAKLNNYLAANSFSEFTLGLCPDCGESLFKDLAEDLRMAGNGG